MPNSPEDYHNSEISAANSDVIETELLSKDSDLTVITSAWPKLSSAARLCLLTIVQNELSPSIRSVE